ncbi:MAG: hypothetical protein U1F57_11590 [bacterium]
MKKIRVFLSVFFLFGAFCLFASTEAKASSTTIPSIGDLGRLASMPKSFGAKMTVLDWKEENGAYVAKVRIDKALKGDVKDGEEKTLKFMNPQGARTGVTRTFLGITPTQLAPGETFIGFFTTNAQGFSFFIGNEDISKYYSVSADGKPVVYNRLGISNQLGSDDQNENRNQTLRQMQKINMNAVDEDAFIHMLDGK